MERRGALTTIQAKCLSERSGTSFAFCLIRKVLIVDLAGGQDCAD